MNPIYSQAENSNVTRLDCVCGAYVILDGGLGSKGFFADGVNDSIVRTYKWRLLYSMHIRYKQCRLGYFTHTYMYRSLNYDSCKDL